MIASRLVSLRLFLGSFHYHIVSPSTRENHRIAAAPSSLRLESEYQRSPLKRAILSFEPELRHIQANRQILFDASAHRILEKLFPLHPGG
jgi:hypothetical protein